MAVITKDILRSKRCPKELLKIYLRIFYYIFILNHIKFLIFQKDLILDKELEQLMFPPSSKHRIADKLVKVHTREGEEKWVLIHLEVQGYEDKHFAERMFTYYYRIWDKYKQKIAALALFTDDKENYRPSKFEMSFLDTSLNFSYKTTKLSDYQPSDFQKSDNPFAIVLETAWYGLAKNKLSDKNLFSLKLDLARRIHKRGISKELFGKICSFIKMYVSFEKPELISNLDNQIDSINKKVRTMGIIEAIQEEIKRQTREETALEVTQEVTKKVTKEVTKEVTAQILKENIQKLYRKGFSVESISEMLELPLDITQNAIK